MAANLFGGGIAPAVPVAPGLSQRNTGASTPQCNVIYVDDMKAVLDHPTSPNEQLYFPEKENSVIWVRETDGNGQIRNPLKRLSYTIEEVPFGPEANFVTKQEHQKLFDLVNNMNATMSGMSETINRLMDELGGGK